MHCWVQEGISLQHIEQLSVPREYWMSHSALPCLNQEQGEFHFPKNEQKMPEGSRNLLHTVAELTEKLPDGFAIFPSCTTKAGPTQRGYPQE